MSSEATAGAGMAEAAEAVTSLDGAQGILSGHTALQDLTFFEDHKRYVGFSEASSALLRDCHHLVAPRFPEIVDDFYAAIEAHPGARAAVTGGAAQLARLKKTLVHWLDALLLGPHDEAYFERRAHIGRVHVRINLPQGYLLAAMNRLRVHLSAVLSQELADRPETMNGTSEALHQILDLELAIMLETYREDLVTKHRGAERLATIGQLAAGIGHELRNPLGVIESSLFLLRQHLGPTVAAAPAVAKHLERIDSEVKRSSKAIRDLLELARNKPPKRRTVPLRALVQAAVEMLGEGAERATVERAFPPELTIDVDPDQLQRVFLNLFVNAVQASKDLARITVQGERRDDGTVRIRIEDDGPGVPAEARSRIFEALFTTKATGTGLGLALSRRIVEAHGGSIELETTSGGASFLLTLPPAARAGALA